MKKIALLFYTAVIMVSIGSGQSYDDGLISTGLSINTGEEKYASFINGFSSGIKKVKNGELKSVEAVTSYYGIDISLFPKIDQLAVAVNTGKNNSGFSDQFLVMLKVAIDKTSGEFTDIMQFRQALLGISSGLSLSSIESEALALLDLGVQEMEKSLIPSDMTFSSPGETSFQTNTFNPLPSGNFSFDSIDYQFMNYRKLPRWFICGVGTLGSAILGGLTGAGSGAQVGALLGAGGAAVGAVVGGIAGVVGGTFTGAAMFC